jgi:carbamoyltransferase
MEAPFILGINASHNGSCCLLRGDRIVAAIQEERLTRRKRHRIGASEPAQSIGYCLETAGITAADLAMVVVCVQKGSRDVRNDVQLNPVLRLAHNNVKCRVISHHLGHAISTFVTSGFTEAAVLVADGVGSYWEDLDQEERAARALGTLPGQEIISLYHANILGLQVIEKHFAPRDRWLSSDAWLYHACPSMPRFESLGGMYSAVAAQIFGDMDEAGKVMGLAPYGSPVHPKEAFYTIASDGHFLFSDAIPAQFQTCERWPKRQQAYEDLAASVQCALESALLYLVERLRKQSSATRLCLAGGLALNSVANERIISEASFSDVHIIPAADDAGVAIGAAYYGLWLLSGRFESSKLLSDGLGRCYSDSEITKSLEDTPAIIINRTDDLHERTAEMLASGQIVGWFQGGAEFGPRALGHRSILCDPRMQGAKDLLNSKVKHRESFRPFAPAVLSDHAADWFDLGSASRESRFMLRVANWRDHARNAVPAVVHVDGTGRLQTVTEADGPFFFLLSAFYRLTNVPILLNTSFNIMGEPIVETPSDALWALLFTGIDYCVIDNRLIRKKAGFGSVLELYPNISKSVLGITLLPRTGVLNFSRDDVVAHVRVERRWGTTEVPITLPQFLAIQLLAAGNSIRDLINAIQRTCPRLHLTDRDGLFVVAALRRNGIVDVKEFSTASDRIIFVDLCRDLENAC